ncbi:hypothetical protein GUJ93_ZPchr0001g32441 [Zizania palustris]|uniref:Pentatricopeptide repeat-containing protein n=1 Tax=Zizania palustris TaxID=103762 RepID=A0A8J5RIR3_ZIZPA|nr:hypothetical protein GUJ93_ZPchr0001g32441 [Zizania palustris]KAG8054236.1 hypothetical protein GUJ93_ZPchr0001g32441 [Zizania palustris]
MVVAGGVCWMWPCGEVDELFYEMPQRDVFSWAIVIDGQGKLYGGVDRTRELFDQMPDRDLVCWNSIIYGYVRHGRMDGARVLFEMPERNVISWSIIIDGYVRLGELNEALEFFQRMLRCGIRHDKVTAVGAVAACAQLGALEQGRWLFSYLEKKVFFDVVVHTTLIDMNMKCVWNRLSYQIRKLMSAEGMKKNTGQSVIEVDGQIHEFVNGVKPKRNLGIATGLKLCQVVKHPDRSKLYSSSFSSPSRMK